MQNKNILIEKFLDGSLTEEERAAFEEMLRDDAILAEETALNQALRKTLRQQQLQRLQHLEQQYKLTRRTNFIRNTVFASIGLAILLFSIYWLCRPLPTIPAEPSGDIPIQIPIPQKEVASPTPPKEVPHKNSSDSSKEQPKSPAQRNQHQIINEGEQEGVVFLDQLANRESAFLNTSTKNEPWKDAFRQGLYPEAMKLLDNKLLNSGKLEDYPIECFYAGAMHTILREGNTQKAINYLEAASKSANKFKKEILRLLITLYWQEGRLLKAQRLLNENPTLKSNIPSSMKKWLNIEDK